MRPVVGVSDLVSDRDQLHLGEAIHECDVCGSDDRSTRVLGEHIGAPGERILGAHAAERPVATVETDVDDDECSVRVRRRCCGHGIATPGGERLLLDEVRLVDHVGGVHDPADCERGGVGAVGEPFEIRRDLCGEGCCDGRWIERSLGKAKRVIDNRNI